MESFSEDNLDPGGENTTKKRHLSERVVEILTNNFAENQNNVNLNGVGISAILHTNVHLLR